MTNTYSASVTRRREGALAPPASPVGALAVLSGNRQRAIKAAMGPRWRPPYLDAVAFIRARGTATQQLLCAHFGWSRSRSWSAVHRAKMHGLIAKIGKRDDGHFIYAPIVVPGWPK